MINTTEYVILNNRSTKSLEIFMEPAAETFYIEPGEEARIEMNRISEKQHPLIIEFLDNKFILTEPGQFDLKILIGSELKYYTSPNKPWA